MLWRSCVSAGGRPKHVYISWYRRESVAHLAYSNQTITSSTSRVAQNKPGNLRHWIIEGAYANEHVMMMMYTYMHIITMNSVYLLVFIV